MTAAADPNAVQHLLGRAGAGATKRGKPSGRPRTHQPVRGGSRYRGEHEGRFWRPVDPPELRAIVEAARHHFLATKEKGKRNAPDGFGHVAIEVLDLMRQRVDWATGALEDAYLYMALRLSRSKDAIWKALRALRHAGFLEWITRSEPTDDGIRQIENAYRLVVPARWSKRVTMRVEQLRRRREAGPATVAAEKRAERAARARGERLDRSRRFLEEAIADPQLRAAAIADLEKEIPSPLNG